MNKWVFFFILLGLCLFTISCGNKRMPRPYVKEDLFFWDKVKFNYTKGCLFVDATIKGKCENLKKVWIGIDEGKCLGCPFNGSFFLPDKIDKKGCKVHIVFCRKLKLPFRFELVGENVYQGLGQTSEVFVVNKR